MNKRMNEIHVNLPPPLSSGLWEASIAPIYLSKAVTGISMQAPSQASAGSEALTNSPDKASTLSLSEAHTRWDPGELGSDSCPFPQQV